MILQKIWYRFTSCLLKGLYHIIYGKHFRYGKNLHMRKGFQITCDSPNGGQIGSIFIGNNVFF